MRKLTIALTIVVVLVFTGSVSYAATDTVTITGYSLATLVSVIVEKSTDEEAWTHIQDYPVGGVDMRDDFDVVVPDLDPVTPYYVRTTATSLNGQTIVCVGGPYTIEEALTGGCPK